MKKMFNITIFYLVIALAFIISLLPGVSNLHQQHVNLNGYIKSIKTETVILINNRFNGEISSRQGRNHFNLSNSYPLLLTHQDFNNLFNNKLLQSNYIIDCNLSVNKQKVHPIRAP